MLSIAKVAYAACGVRGVLVPSSQLAIRYAQTEAGRSHMHADDPTEIQQLKEKALKGESEATIPGAEGWSHGLACESEAVVKAEKAPEVPIAQMQAHTVEVIKQVHHEETSIKTGIDVSKQPSMKANLEKSDKA